MKNIKALTVLLIILFVSVVGFSEVKKTYYESGALKAEFYHKNGKLEGPAKVYFESCALEKEFTYNLPFSFSSTVK